MGPSSGTRQRFFFSHLYTAVDQREYQEFLGIDPEHFLGPDPVPLSKLKELEEFMTWLYGRKSKGLAPIVQKQDPDLNTLREVIAKPEALGALRTTRSLERSHAVAIGDTRRFSDSLIQAKLALQDAMATVTSGYHGEENLYGTIEEISGLVRNVAQVMIKTMKEASAFRKQRTPRGRQ